MIQKLCELFLLYVYEGNMKIPYQTEFMTPKSEWDKLVREKFFVKLNGDHIHETHLRQKTSYMAYYQFCFTEVILKNCGIPFKLLHRQSNDNVFDRDIFTPHDDLKSAFWKYQKEAFSLPNSIIELYNKSKLLFEKILSVEHDDEKWVEALKEANDDLFVQQNIEFRLGKNMENKNLWKLYIAYLKEHNPKILLHTYSKYCRFWTDDIEMRKEYEEQVNLHGPIEVPWTNLFNPTEKISLLQGIKYMIFGSRPPEFQPKPFEKHASIGSSMIFDYYSSRNYQREKLVKPCMIFYSKNRMIFQQFPYCSTIISFILKNANANVLQKLYKSCKEFYSKQSTPVCYKLTLQTSCAPLQPITHFEESLIIGNESPASIYCDKKLVIKTCLWVSGNKNFPKMLSSFLPKLHRCDAKFIELYYQHLTVDEFKFLTKNGTVEEIILIESPIIDENKELLSFESIMEMVLSVRSIEFSNSCSYTYQTAQILSELPFKYKIQRFFLWDVDVELDPNAFCKYVEKNAASSCRLKIRFKCNKDYTSYKKELFDKINATIAKKWNHPNFHPICIPEKPRISFTPIAASERAPFVEKDPTWNYNIKVIPSRFCF